MDVTRIDLMIATASSSKPGPVERHASRRRIVCTSWACAAMAASSLLTHLYALLKMAKLKAFQEVFVHCFMDGRDTPPESGAGFVEQSRRDPDHRRGQDRFGGGPLLLHGSRQTLGAHRARLQRHGLGKGEKATDPVAAVEASYERGVTDEFSSR